MGVVRPDPPTWERGGVPAAQPPPGGAGAPGSLPVARRAGGACGKVISAPGSAESLFGSAWACAPPAGEYFCVEERKMRSGTNPGAREDELSLRGAGPGRSEARILTIVGVQADSRTGGASALHSQGCLGRIRVNMGWGSKRLRQK